MCRLLWFMQILLIPLSLLGDWLLMAEHSSYWCHWWLFILRDQPSLGRRFYPALCFSDRSCIFVAAVCLRVYRGDWGVVSLNPYRKHGSIQPFFFPAAFSPFSHHLPHFVDISDKPLRRLLRKLAQYTARSCRTPALRTRWTRRTLYRASSRFT